MRKCALAILLAGAGWGQSPQPTPQEILEQSRRDLQGNRDDFMRPQIVEPGRPSGSGRIEFYSLPSRTERPTGESVSVERLKHQVPKEAQKAADKADKLSRSGDHVQAIALLETAIARDPEFAAAHRMLGAEYALTGRRSEGQKQLERAVELDPYDADAHYDLGLIQFEQGDPSHAVEYVTRALELSTANPYIHFLLGYLQLLREDTRQSGVEHLRYAARTMPMARQILEYVEKGKR